MIRLFNHYISIGVLAVLLGDVAFAALATGILAGLSGSFPDLSPVHPLATGAVWTLSLAFVFFQGGLYDPMSFETDRRNMIRLISAFVLLAGVGTLAMKFVPAIRLGWRGVLALSGLTFALVAFWRWVLVQWLPVHEWKRSTLILGTGQIARIFEELNRFRHNIRIQAVVDAQKIKEMNLARYALDHKIHSIVISLKDRRGTLPIHEILACKMNGIEVMEWPTFYEKNMNKIDIMNVNPSHLILGDGFPKNRIPRGVKGGHGPGPRLRGAGPLRPLRRPDRPGHQDEQPGSGPLQPGAGGLERQTLQYLQVPVDGRRRGEEPGSPVGLGTGSPDHEGGPFPAQDAPRRGSPAHQHPEGGDEFHRTPARAALLRLGAREVHSLGTAFATSPSRGSRAGAQIRYRYGATVEDAVKKLEYDLYYVKTLAIFLDLRIVMETIRVILFGKGSR
ncbi:MAG: Glycosyl transferase [Leptospirillum sp. Group IV 'UBA BS']|nr:MAG: Glycosyl transferase [Leptospirillum sp. Group IV 'UBA BS']